jgi:hypothetical protein
MNLRLQVCLHPTQTPDIWVLRDTDGRTLLTSSLEDIARAVFYIQFALERDIRGVTKMTAKEKQR